MHVHAAVFLGDTQVDDKRWRRDIAKYSKIIITHIHSYNPTNDNKYTQYVG